MALIETPLPTLKMQATVALRGRLDKVVIQDGHLDWTRRRGDTKWAHSPKKTRGPKP